VGHPHLWRHLVLTQLLSLGEEKETWRVLAWEKEGLEPCCRWQKEGGKNL
jgi:hypothetical protein